jgi:hypothetical protein
MKNHIRSSKSFSIFQSIHVQHIKSSGNFSKREVDVADKSFESIELVTWVEKDEMLEKLTILSIATVPMQTSGSLKYEHTYWE